jgi:hypothetical protein
MTTYHPPERYRPESPGPERPVSPTVPKETRTHPYPELLKLDDQCVAACYYVLQSLQSNSALRKVHNLVRTAPTEARALIIETCRDPYLLRKLLEEGSEKGHMEVFLIEKLRELSTDLSSTD